MFVRKNKEQNDLKNFNTISEGIFVISEGNNEIPSKIHTERNKVKENVIYGNFGLLKQQYINNQRNRGSEGRMLTRDQ